MDERRDPIVASISLQIKFLLGNENVEDTGSFTASWGILRQEACDLLVKIAQARGSVQESVISKLRLLKNDMTRTLIP